jgi:GT2 family glycosyltransferase
LAIETILKEKQFESILVINNDAEASDGSVEKLMATLRRYKGKAIVAPRSSATSSTPSMLWYHRYLSLVLTKPLPGAFPYLSGACLLIPTSLISPYLFDPDFFMYGEDVEFSHRMTLQGIPLVISDAKYNHAGSLSSRKGSFFYEYNVVKGHIILIRKLARGPFDKILLIFGRAIFLPLRAFIRSIRSRSLTPLFALLAGVFMKRNQINPK